MGSSKPRIHGSRSKGPPRTAKNRSRCLGSRRFHQGSGLFAGKSTFPCRERRRRLFGEGFFGWDAGFFRKEEAPEAKKPACHAEKPALWLERRVFWRERRFF